MPSVGLTEQPYEAGVPGIGRITTLPGRFYCSAAILAAAFVLVWMRLTTGTFAGQAEQGPIPVLLVRQDTHVGSWWLMQLLESSGVHAYRRSDGVCRGPARNASASPRGLRALLAAGCGCKSVYANGDASSEKLVLKAEPFCRGQCSSSTAPCKAVAAMADTIPAHYLLKSIEHDASDSAGTRKASPRIVLLQRENIAMRVISSLKADCWARDLQGHATPVDLPNVSHPTSMLVDPELFLEEALNSARRQQQLERLFPRDQVAHTTSYEELQLDSERAVAHLLAGLGLESGPARQADAQKLRHEQLQHLLVNFDELKNATQHWPCLLAQLRSSSPQRWAPCHPRTWPAHQLRHVEDAGRAVMIECQSMTCRGLPKHHRVVPFDRCFGGASGLRPHAARTLGRRLCGRALAHVRKQHPAVAMANVCVRTLDAWSTSNNDDTWLQRAMPLLRSALRGKRGHRTPRVRSKRGG